VNSTDTPVNFNESGHAVTLTDPRFMRAADFDLWNDQMVLKLDHCGNGSGQIFTPNPQPYADNMRPVFLVDTESGVHASLSWGPVFRAPERFAFTVHLDAMTWEQRIEGIDTRLSVALPRSANLEAWTAVVTNASDRPRRLRLVPAFPMGMIGLLTQESSLIQSPFGIVHQFFPYYVKIPDYDKLARRWNVSYFVPDRAPDSWTASESDLLGFSGWSAPEAVISGSLGRRHAHYERSVCAAAYELTLTPGERFELNWIFGPARDEQHLEQVLRAFPPAQAHAIAVAQQAEFRALATPAFRVSSPDRAMDHFVNHWAVDRSIRIGRTFRFNPSPQARNAIQDSMAMAWFEPRRARDNFLRIWAHQNGDGFMPHGLPMFPDAEIMPITLIPHRDINAWGPLSLDLYVRETNDLDILNEPVPFADGGSASLAEHLERGLSWLLRDRTERGLSRIGQGDWNDPLNMAGPEGRGESVWLTEALAHACTLWASVCARAGRDAGAWREAAEQCRMAVRAHCWDGDWFVRAFSDDGIRIGSRENDEGAIYLNAQSWALMAGIPDADQTLRIIDAVRRHLGDEMPPALLAPPYRGMRKHVGKLTIKSPGTGENGSIYSHACLFWAHALYRAGFAEEAWRCFRNLIPGGPANPLSRAGQLPIYIPNFFRGPAFPEVFGNSSHSPNTGSAAWCYMVFLEDVLGLRADGDGLCIAPNLPSGWNDVSATRIFRGNTYHVRFRRDSSATGLSVTVDGNASLPRIPWVPSDKVIEVEVVLPPASPTAC